MFAHDLKSVEAMTGPAREMFEQWISFFPTAPLFGVKWRFADSAGKWPADLGMQMPGFALFAGLATGAAKPDAAAEPGAAMHATPVEAAVVVEPPAEPAPEPEAAAGDGGSVEQIRGIGPRLAEELAEMGITTVAQIAALSRAELAKIDARLNSIRGRCFRDDWVGQAKALMAA